MDSCHITQSATSIHSRPLPSLPHFKNSRLGRQKQFSIGAILLLPGYNSIRSCIVMSSRLRLKNAFIHDGPLFAWLFTEVRRCRNALRCIVLDSEACPKFLVLHSGRVNAGNASSIWCFDKHRAA